MNVFLAMICCFLVTFFDTPMTGHESQQITWQCSQWFNLGQMTNGMFRSTGSTWRHTQLQLEIPDACPVQLPDHTFQCTQPEILLLTVFQICELVPCFFTCVLPGCSSLLAEVLHINIPNASIVCCNDQSIFLAHLTRHCSLPPGQSTLMTIHRQ